MRELEKGMFARSLAGHDRGKLYIVLDAEGDRILLTDGKLRPVGKPKIKNRIHIQPDFEQSGVFSGENIHPDEWNAAIRKAIKNKEDLRCQKQM